MAEPTIAVVGDVGVDEYLYCSVNRLNPEAPIPLLDRQQSTKSLAMAGLVACMVKALGAIPRLVCLGDHIRPFVETAGLSTDYIVPWKGRLIRKRRYMASAAGRPHQPVLRVDDEQLESLDEETKLSIIRSCDLAIDGADAVVVSDYGKGLCHESVLWNVMRMAKLRGVPVLVDPFRGCDSWQRYTGATVIKANRGEAAAAGFVWDGGHRTRSVEHVVVTLDGDGYVLCNQSGEKFRAAAVKHSVLDVVGAGDQFIAAMAVALAGGFGDGNRAVERACILGNVAAGLQVSRSGCVPVTRAELLDGPDGGPNAG